MTWRVGRASIAVTVIGALACAGLAACDKKPEPPKPVTWSATAELPDGSAPDAATLARARDIVADRLKVGGTVPDTEVTIDGDRTLRLRLTPTDTSVDWDVRQRLRPGRVLLRPVRRQEVEKPELADVAMTDQPDPQALATMAPDKQYASDIPTCGLLLVRDPADTADASTTVAACDLRSSGGTALTSTKYLLGPAVLGDGDITGVTCASGAGGRHDLTFALSDAARARLRAAKGQVAVVLDGFVLATVTARTDPVTISGFFLAQQVAVLCAEPGYAPLPVVLTPEFPQ